MKISGFYNVFLNILLFTPFGFGLAEKLREGGKSRRFTLAIALIVGALFSYGIEFLQIYIPERDSGWEDVVTNSTGSVVGFLLFEGLGRTVLPILSACERALTAVLSGWRVALVLLLYFGFWFAASIHLQRESGLSNWNPDSLLVIGNDAAGKNAWTGQIRLVQIGDRAISNDQVKRVLAAESVNITVPGLRASFDLSSATPLHDQLHFLPNLVWTPRIPAHLETNSLVLDGSTWLSSSVNVADLIQDLRRSNQFTIRIVCTPGTTNGVDARILSVSQPSGLSTSPCVKREQLYCSGFATAFRSGDPYSLGASQTYSGWAKCATFFTPTTARISPCTLMGNFSPLATNSARPQHWRCSYAGSSRTNSTVTMISTTLWYSFWAACS